MRLSEIENLSGTSAQEAPAEQAAPLTPDPTAPPAQDTARWGAEVDPSSLRKADADRIEPVHLDVPELKDGLFQVPEEQVAEWKSKGPIGPFEQWGRLDKTEMLPVWGGAESVAKSVSLLNAVNRVKNDSYGNDTELRQRDADAIGNFLLTQEEERVRGVSGWGQVMSGATQLPAFMIEFALTGGAEALGKIGVKKLAVTALREGAQAGLTKAVARAAAPIAGAATRSVALPMLPRAGANVAERMLQSNLQLTDKGVQILQEASETPMVSWAKGLGDHFIENYSETAGTWIVKAGGAMIPNALVKSMEKVFKKMHPNKAVRALWTKAGYNGFLGELGEERFGDLLRAVTGVEDFGAKDPASMLDRIISSWPNGQQWMVEAGVLMIPGLAHATAQQTARMIKAGRPIPADTTKELSDSQAAEIAAKVLAEQAKKESTATSTVEGKGPGASAESPEAGRSAGTTPEAATGQEDISFDFGANAPAEEAPVEVKAPAKVQSVEEQLLNVVSGIQSQQRSFTDNPNRDLPGESAGVLTPGSSDLTFDPELAAWAGPLGWSASAQREADKKLLKRAIAGEKLSAQSQKRLDRLKEMWDFGQEDMKARQEVPTEAQDPRVQILEEGRSAKIVGNNLWVAITPSVKVKGKYQVTTFNKDGLPMGDFQADSFEQALKRGTDEAGVVGIEELKSAIKAGFLREEDLSDIEKSMLAPTEEPQPKPAAEDVLVLEGRIDQLVAESDAILDKIDALEEHKKALEKAGRSTKAVEAKQAKLAQEFDYIDSVIGNLMTEAEPRIKERDKILTTVGKALRTINAKIKEGVGVTKNEIKEAQTDLVNFLEASPLDLKARAGFLRAVKNIQSFDDLSKALPEILERVEKTQEANRKRQALSKLFNILKKSKTRLSGGRPKGKFTADTQRILDMARKAIQMPRFEAELKIQENLAKATKEGLDDILVLENTILDTFADPKTRTADQLEAMLAQLQEIMKEGRTIVEIRAEARKARADMFRQEAIKTLQGTAPVTDADKPKNKAVQAVKRALATIGKSMSGWDDLLNVFSQDSKSKSFESWMNQNLSTITVEAAEKVAIHKWGEKFRTMAMEKLGFKKESQFFKWLKDGEQEVDLGEFRDADNKPVRLVLSRSVARKVWMDLQQPDIRESIISAEGGYRIGAREVNGITPDMEKALMQFLTPEDIDFAKGQIAFYKEYYPHVNAKFRVDFGVDLPMNENYSPIRREVSHADMVATILDEKDLRGSLSPSSLKSRSKNREKIIGQSDVSVLMRHIIEMEHYINWADKLRDLQSVFGDSRVKNIIRAKFGESALKNVNEYLTDFLRGSGEKARLYDAQINKFIGNFTVSVLALKPAMTLKQMSSFAAFWDAIPTKDFFAGLADFVANPVAATQTLMNTDMMRTRGENITREIQDGLGSREFSLLRKSPTFKNYMLFFTKLGDQGSIVVGGWPVYKYHLAKTGSHEKAVEEFEKFATRTQQSSYLSQLSSWQRGNSLQRLFTLFTSAQNQYLRQEIAAVRDGMKGRLTPAQVAKKLAIYHIVLPNLFQWIANFGHWDEEEQIRASILGSLNGVFLMGDIMDSVVRRALNEMADFELDEFGGALPIDQIRRAMLKAISDLTDEDIYMEDVIEAVAALSANVVGPLAGLPVKQILSGYEGGQDIAEGEIAKGMLKLGGWSPRLVNKYLGEDDIL